VELVSEFELSFEVQLKLLVREVTDGDLTYVFAFFVATGVEVGVVPALVAGFKSTSGTCALAGGLGRVGVVVGRLFA
jgi:hypothetical protein